MIFSTTVVLNSSLSEKNCTRYDQKMYIDLHEKYPLFLSDFSEICIFYTDFRKYYEIRPVGSICFLRIDGQTLRSFPKFCERARKQRHDFIIPTFVTSNDMRSKWKITMNFRTNILSSQGIRQIYIHPRLHSHTIVIPAVGNYNKLNGFNVSLVLNSAFLAKVTFYKETITAQL